MYFLSLLLPTFYNREQNDLCTFTQLLTLMSSSLDDDHDCNEFKKIKLFGCMSDLAI